MGVEYLEKIICDNHKVKMEDLKTRSRYRNFVDARNQFMFILVKYLNYNLSQASTIFNRNHATCINSIRNVQNNIETNNNYRLKFYRIVDQFLFSGVEVTEVDLISQCVPSDEKFTS